MKSFLVLLFISGNAFAMGDFPARPFGDQVGNGGKLIVCRNQDDEITSTKLLDFYESEILYGLSPAFVGATFIEKAANATDRLARVDPRRSSQYGQQVAGFLRNTRFVTSPLMETPDSDHIIAPPVGCKIEQVAIQLRPSFPQDRLFTINLALWDTMTEIDKAGLVLHEVIYVEAIARGHKNSIGVRYINAYLASGRIDELNQSEYFDLMSASKLRTMRVEDPQSHLIWTFLDSINVNWEMAKRACNELEQSNIPTPIELEAAKVFLISSSIEGLVGESDIPETWTSYRRPADGTIAVGFWTHDNIDLVFRPRNEASNILCVNP